VEKGGKHVRRLNALLNSCFFLFILLYSDPPVIYSNNGFDLYNWVQSVPTQGRHPGSAEYLETRHHPIYNLELTRSFFREAFSRPGGFTFLAVCSLISACHIAVLGSVAILLAALLIYWAFPVYVKNSGGPDLLITRWIPCIFVLLSCCLYDLYLFGFFIAIIGALILAIVFQRISGSRRAAIVVFFAFFWLSYYLLAWAALLFIVLVFIHEAWTRPRQMAPLGVVAAVSLGVLYFLESRYLPLESTIRWREFIAPPLPPVAIICYFPLIALGVRLQPQLQLPRKIRRRVCSPLIRAALLVLIAAAAIFYSVSDPVLHDTRTIARTMHHLLNRQWDAILKDDAPSIFQNKSAALPQVLMVNVVDRALYKTGRLGSDMFSYPQSHNYPESLLLLKRTLTIGYAKWAAGLDLYMDLGAANYAEKVAGEMMGNMGPYPFLLERRALIQSAKGNYEAATVYLHRLSGMPFYRREAAGLLAMIKNGTIAQDERVSHLASCMDASDYLLYHPPDDSVLSNLLKRNPRNRMAWEYLIAYYLQTGRPSKILGEIGRCRDFGYEHLPANWDEALCIALRGDPALNAADLPVMPRQEAFECCERFLRACDLYRRSPPGAAVAALEPSFGSTYFFFYVFGFTWGRTR
jgi:hypothetical protein